MVTIGVAGCEIICFNPGCLTATAQVAPAVAGSWDQALPCQLLLITPPLSLTIPLLTAPTCLYHLVPRHCHTNTRGMPPERHHYQGHANLLFVAGSTSRCLDRTLVSMCRCHGLYLCSYQLAGHVVGHCHTLRHVIYTVLI
jgi:hypothetical protein